jgi:membrane protein
VIKGFIRNRCPTHASSLAYTSLLAMIPMLFVVISISGSILKKEGGERVYHFIDSLLVNMTPASAMGTNAAPASAESPNIAKTNHASLADVATNAAPANITTSETNNSSATNALAGAGGSGPEKDSAGREQIISSINGFIRNIQNGSLGVKGVAVLLVMAISMLSNIESTFNTIWGVSRGRNWMARVIRYWTVISLGPVLLAVALSLAKESHWETNQILHLMPFGRRILLESAPVVVLCLTFGLFYLLMPNTKVHWGAALVGGIVSGILWNLNNYFSVLFVSRWAMNSRIYGSALAVIPVFMVGLYISWLIVLFGAQVAYAFQNRKIYMEEMQAKNISQRGREFIAFRLMEYVGQRYLLAKPPVTEVEIAAHLMVPPCLVEEIMEPLMAVNLVVQTSGAEPAYAPGRPLENITCHDILLALRSGQGQELVTRDDPARAEVFGEYERIMEAEKKAASSITMLALIKAVAFGKSA